jgi:deoxyribose-phosphate aldolase
MSAIPDKAMKPLHDTGQDHLPQLHRPRNPGMALDLDWIARVQANTSAIERRAATLPGRRTVKKDHQAAWLARAITLHRPDHAGGRRHARPRPAAVRQGPPAGARPDLLDALGLPASPRARSASITRWSKSAVAALAGTGIPVAAVSTGFPAGLSPYHLRLREIGESVKAGAAEIDIVISRRHVLTGDWQALYDEMREFRAACGPAHVKAILATGELGTLRNVARASLVCMMAGADFIKTSTGKESVNATLPVSASR